MKLALTSLFGKLPAARAGQRWAELLSRADLARDRNDWPAAARDYAAAIAEGCGNLRVQVQLGHALKELGRYDEAEAAYRSFLAATPFDADIHLQLGHLFNRQDDPAAALDWYERAQRLAPADAEIARHVATARRRAQRAGLWRKRETAMALVEARRWTQARALLSELVEDDGEDELIGILANVTKEAGDLDAAAALYARYLAFAQAGAPNLLADVELQTGHLHKVRGDYRGALRHYIRARRQARLQPGHDPDDAVYDVQISSCVAEIYTCFWTQRA